MEIGKKVRIIGNIFNGKEGVVEEINDDKATVYVDFNVDEGKRVRQDYFLNELEEVFEESLEESKKKNTSIDKGALKRIEFYEMPSGRVPMIDFLESIEDKKLKEKTVKNILSLDGQSNLSNNSITYLEDGIYELRTQQSNNITRAFYFFVYGNKIVMTNGYIKKQQKVDKGELGKAKNYMNDYLKSRFGKKGK